MARSHFTQADARRLVRKLRGLQAEQNLTMEDMAQRLGVSTSMLSMVYGGRRRPGRRFLQGVLQAYPKLRDEVYLYLLREPVEHD